MSARKTASTSDVANKKRKVGSVELLFGSVGNRRDKIKHGDGASGVRCGLRSAKKLPNTSVMAARKTASTSDVANKKRQVKKAKLLSDSIGDKHYKMKHGDGPSGAGNHLRSAKKLPNVSIMAAKKIASRSDVANKKRKLKSAELLSDLAREKHDKIKHGSGPSGVTSGLRSAKKFPKASTMAARKVASRSYVENKERKVKSAEFLSDSVGMGHNKIKYGSGSSAVRGSLRSDKKLPNASTMAARKVASRSCMANRKVKYGSGPSGLQDSLRSDKKLPNASTMAARKVASRSHVANKKRKVKSAELLSDSVRKERDKIKHGSGSCGVRGGLRSDKKLPNACTMAARKVASQSDVENKKKKVKSAELLSDSVRKGHDKIKYSSDPSRVRSGLRSDRKLPNASTMAARKPASRSDMANKKRKVKSVELLSDSIRKGHDKIKYGSGSSAVWGGLRSDKKLPNASTMAASRSDVANKKGKVKSAELLSDFVRKEHDKIKYGSGPSGVRSGLKSYRKLPIASTMAARKAASRSNVANKKEKVKSAELLSDSVRKGQDQIKYGGGPSGVRSGLRSDRKLPNASTVAARKVASRSDVVNEKKKVESVESLFYSAGDTHDKIKCDDDSTWSHLRNANKPSNTSLHIATHNGDVRLVKRLLDRGTNVNAAACDDNTPLSKSPDPNDCVTYRLQMSIDRADTPLHIAIRTGRDEIVKILLYNGSDVTAVNKFGCTPLHIACAFGNVELVKILLDGRSNVNAMVGYDDTELQGTSETRLEGGILKGDTPVLIAARNRHAQILELLFDKGANFNATDQNGNTALHLTVYNFSFTPVTEMLLNVGADVNIVNRDNEFPLDKAYGMSRNILLQHLVKLRSIHFFLHGKNLQAINRYPYLVYFQHECEKEIESLKSAKIGGNVSFFDILTENVNRLAKYARNIDFAQVLESSDYGERFQLYCEVIKNCLLQGMERKKLLESGHEFFFRVLTGLPPLPYHCAEKILLSLSNEDLAAIGSLCK